MSHLELKESYRLSEPEICIYVCMFILEAKQYRRDAD